MLGGVEHTFLCESIGGVMPETEKIKVYYLASGNIGIPLLKALLKSEKLELTGIASQLKESKSCGPVRTAKSRVVEWCE